MQKNQCSHIKTHFLKNNAIWLYILLNTKRFKNITQCSAVLFRVVGAVQSSTFQCTANQQLAIQWSSMSPGNWIAVYFKTFQWSAMHKKAVPFNSMDNNVDQGSAVECTAAHPRLTKSPKEEEKSLYIFFSIGASISIGREIRCLPYAGSFSTKFPLLFTHWLG